MSMLGFDAVGKLALGQLPTASGAAQTPSAYSRWPDVAKKSGLTAAVIATTFAGFVPPPPAQATTAFAEFSRPQDKAHQADSWNFIAPPQVQPAALFSAFDQRAIDQILIDEQPAFAVQAPQPPPFTGFASFERPLRALKVVIGYQDWWIGPQPLPDTHDGVFVKKKRKGKKYDPAKDELDIRAKRRGAIYDALVPKVEYSLPDLVLPPRAVPPPNVEDLAQMVMAARQQAEMEARQREIEADDDDLEMILKDIL